MIVAILGLTHPLIPHSKRPRQNPRSEPCHDVVVKVPGDHGIADDGVDVARVKYAAVGYVERNTRRVFVLVAFWWLAAKAGEEVCLGDELKAVRKSQ